MIDLLNFAGGVEPCLIDKFVKVSKLKGIVTYCSCEMGEWIVGFVDFDGGMRACGLQKLRS